MELFDDRYENSVNSECLPPDESYEPFFNIKLKKGEQKRIPIPVELAEVVE